MVNCAVATIIDVAVAALAAVAADAICFDIAAVVARKTG